MTREPSAAKLSLTIVAAVLIAGCMGSLAGNQEFETLEPVVGEVNLQQDDHDRDLQVPGGEPLEAESTVEEQLHEPGDVEYLEDEGEVTYPMASEGDEAVEHESDSLYAFKDSICGRTARDEFPEVFDQRGLNWSSVGLTYVDDRWAVTVGADEERRFGGEPRYGATEDESHETGGEGNKEYEGSETQALLEGAPNHVESHVEWHAEGLEWQCTVPVVLRSGLEDAA